MNHQNDGQPDYYEVPDLDEGERSIRGYIATVFDEKTADMTDVKAMVTATAIHRPDIPMSTATGKIIAGQLGLDEFEEVVRYYRK